VTAVGSGRSLHKVITLVRRSPSVDPAAFGEKWRQQAQADLVELPLHATPLRLIHYVTRPGRDGRNANPCDGIAVAWFATDEAAARSRPQSRLPVPDPAEGAAAAGPAQPVSSFRVEERIAAGADWLEQRWAQPDPEPALALIGFIEARPGLTRHQFRDYWWETHRPLADRLVPEDLGPLAYVHNYILDDESSPWAGIGEIYERSLNCARRRGEWFATDTASPVIADEERFLVPASRKVLVTDQEVLKRVS
jgi:hypothetical protein